MLILTRGPHQSLRIGDDITVTILGVKGRQVRVGVDAPRNVAVHRQEIYERIRAEQAAGIDGSPAAIAVDDRVTLDVSA